jgi:MOSC domain-containing protein YiiM
MPTVVSLNRSKGGVPKLPADEAWAGETGLEGDRQRNRLFHGGPQRALCLYSAELMEKLRAEGHPIAPGTTGENVTVSGLDWSLMKPGARLRVGGALVEITSYTTPCKNIAGSFADGEFTRISQKLHPGWSRVYARVVDEGPIRVGDAVEMVGG